jgi:hypothetical protein
MPRNIENNRKWRREWMRKRRADFFYEKKCSFCEDDKCLELHHVNPAEKESRCVWSWSQERREKELKKCIVLCKKCHKEETRKQLAVEWNHGTSYGYRTHGCRCELCREAQRLYMIGYRKSRLVKI